jgi:hypothetical protein
MDFIKLFRTEEAASLFVVVFEEAIGPTALDLFFFLVFLAF